MANNYHFDVVLKKAMAICARKEMCLKDIRHKLLAWGTSDKDADRILNYLIKERFIDEERYSVAFVKDKFRYNKWGRVKIAAALKSKEIPGELIIKSLESIDNKTYMDMMRDLVSKHRRTVRAKNQYDLKGKLLRFGLSKGFESHLLYDLLNEIDQ